MMTTQYTIRKSIGGYSLDIKQFNKWSFYIKDTNKKHLIKYAKNKFPEAVSI